MTLTADDLHRAADRLGAEAPSPLMDELAEAGARFLRESNIWTDGGVTPVELTVEQALGYGVMLGWLARDADG